MRNRHLTIQLSAALLLLLSICRGIHQAEATAVSTSSAKSSCRRSNNGNLMELCTVSSIVEAPSSNDATTTATTVTPTASPSSNPIVQLLTYVKDTMVNFASGLSQMNSDHKRCNAIRSKQVAYAKSRNGRRPRGIAGCVGVHVNCFGHHFTPALAHYNST